MMADDTTSGVGQRIRALRRERGVTLDELGRATGLDISFLSRVERGYRTATRVQMGLIAKALRVSARSLLSGDE